MSQPETFILALNQWITVFMHRSMQNMHRYAKESGYSMSQIFALNFIHHRGRCGVTDLGEGMGVSNAAASQMLDKLAHQEMIERTEDPTDRRVKQITLTEKGTQVIKDSLFARQSWFRELEQLLSEEERQLSISALKTLTDKGKQLGLYETTNITQLNSNN
ncbi:MAG: MarR family transcriptional regulator [Anaerolineales bacterium]|jgi:DNA-binding MarR family transcriptional regulator